MPQIKVASTPSVRRLPAYLLLARQASSDGEPYISATLIANELSLEPIQVRKDLTITGIAGKPKKGYPVVELVRAIEVFLGWDQTNQAIVVGAGHLGSALMGYPGFKLHGLHIVAAFDTETAKTGKPVNGVPVYPMDQLVTRLAGFSVSLAILTVPRDQAQLVADQLLAAGVKAIWNFTNFKVKTPPGVVVQNEDLSSGYALLSVKRRVSEDLYK